MKLFSSSIICLLPLLLLGGAPQNPSPPSGFTNIGIGGGGGMFAPACSPHSHSLMLVSCDMSGVYRSTNGGRSWHMLDKRDLRSAISCPPLFDPQDPNTIYAPGASLLRVSHDAGKTWKPLTENPPWGTDTITALGADPDRPQTLLVGTQTAAYRSDDGGQKWIKLNGVHGRVLNFFVDTTTPPSRRTVFAGTSAGIFRSDNPATWRDVSQSLPGHDLRGFCGGSDPKTGQVALYCTLPGKAVEGRLVGGVYRSRDRGNSWQSAMGKGINAEIGKKDEYGIDEVPQYECIAMARTHPNIVYVTTRGTGYWPPYHWTVYRCDDFGNSWHYCFTGDPRFKDRNVEIGWIPVELSWGFGGPPIGFNVCATNPDIAMYTNDAELYITRNGGKTWECAYSHRVSPQGDIHRGEAWSSIGLEVTSCWQLAFDPHDSRRVYICYTDIGFARSEDRGQSWRLSVAGSPWANTWYQIAFDPDRPGVLYAACSNQHDIPHWTNIETVRFGGGVCLSENYGATWKPLRNGLPDAPATSIALDSKSPRNARTLYTAIFGHGVFQSTDGGATWHNISEGLGLPANRHIYSVKLHPDGTLFCSITGKRTGTQFADGSGLYRSRDKGKSWQIISPPLKWAGDFDFDPRDSRILYLAAATPPGFPQGGLYKTADGGVTWRQVLKEGDFPKDLGSYVHAFFVAVNPKRPDMVYLSATTHGLFLSENAGATWCEVKGIPFAPLQRVTFDPDNDAIIWVTSFGGGVWKGPARGAGVSKALYIR